MITIKRACYVSLCAMRITVGDRYIKTKILNIDCVHGGPLQNIPGYISDSE